jgi:cytochrome oxidase Cu insertion factor (SCO1/SenC/PrrC family)
MSEKREFFDRVFRSPDDNVPRPEIRDIGVNETGQIVDNDSGEPITDPLRLDEQALRRSIVMVNFFSTRYEEDARRMATLKAIADELGSRVGDHIFLTSISRDPSHDTAERLQAYAKELGAPAGWSFVRASDKAHQNLNQRIFRVRGYTSAKEVFYGTPGGFWGTFPADNSPEEVAHRLIRSVPGPRPSKPRRAGPARLGEYKYSWTAREV